MSFVGVLHDLVCADARISPTGDNQLHLKELDSSATLKKVVIILEQGSSSSCVALDFKVASRKNRSSCLSDVLNPDSSHPLRAACDAIVCVEKNTATHLIHIELKSGDDKRCSGQLRNSRCFSRFLRELACEWYGIKTASYQEWFVLLTSGRRAVARKRKTPIKIDSRPVMERPSNNPDKPATFVVENDSKVHVGNFFRS